MSETNIRKFVIAGGVVVAVFLIWPRLFKRRSPSSEMAAALNVSPRAEAYIGATILHEILRQCYTPGARVFEFFNANAWLNSNNAIAELFTAFGVRPYDKCIGGLPDWFYIERDMFQWLHQVLNDSEKTDLNNLWKSRGITFQI